MHASQQVLDKPSMAPYRIAILGALKSKDHRLARNGRAEGRPVLVNPGAINKIRSFYQWDQTIVCPRYGYDSVEAYYADVSVGPRLEEIQAPALMVFTQNDPLIPIDALAPYFDRVNSTTDIQIVSRGGHLGFSRNLDLGWGHDLGLCQQVQAWITAHQPG
jgi:predicted alpha/beta-fold hydrolase